MSTPAALGLPSIAPFTAAPALPGVPYGSPYVPLRSPGEKSRTRRRAATFTAEARAWAEHAAGAAFGQERAQKKALDAVAFSAEIGARSLAIPSKLQGVAQHQPAVAALAHLADQHERAGLGFPLAVHVTEDNHIAVSFQDEHGGLHVLGRVQSKHVLWLRPLLAIGAAVKLVAVTGRQPGRTMGVNIVFAFAGRAAEARRFMAGDEPRVSPADILLRRHRDGAEAQLGRSGRFLRDTIEWGYNGAGPARLALAVLRQFCPVDDARRLAGDFKREVIAHVPERGAVLEAAFIRTWLASKATN